MNKFNVGDKVRINSEGSFLYELFSTKPTDVWTIKECIYSDAVEDYAYKITCNNKSFYVFKYQITKVEEEETMNISNITRKSVASIEERNNESARICHHCGCVINMLDDDREAIQFDGEWYCDEDCLDAVSKVCDHCGEREYIGNMTVVNGEYICEDCIDCYYFFCPACERYHESMYGNWCESESEYICVFCLDSRNGYFRCSRCGDVHSTDDMYEVYWDNEESSGWCPSCVDYYASYCEECERYFNNSRVTVEEGRCEFCEPPAQHCENIEDWKAPHGVRQYSYKPDPCFCMTKEQKETCDQSDLIYLGFELEMEDHEHYGSNVDDDADYLNGALGYTYCKHDGSINNGLELVSHPATLEYMMENKSLFVEALGAMRDRGYTSHDNGHCGLHFHVSIAPMLERNEHAVSCLLKIMDEHWDDLVTFSRRTESQLEEWAQRYYTKGQKPKDLHKNAKEHNKHDRYMAINLRNTHTVEIRMFRGTLNVETFFATAQMVQRLVDVSIECKDPDVAHEITWDKILDCDYEELKSYCDRRFNKKRIEVSKKPTRTIQIDSDDFRTMHLANIRVGDIVRVDTCPEIACNPDYIGLSGPVTRVEDDHINCEGVFAYSRASLNIHPLHAYRTNPIRVGDYVKLIVNNKDNQNANPFDIEFNDHLPVGVCGIVRVINENDYGIEFTDFPFPGHDLNFAIASTRGQYIPKSCVELI